MVSCVSCNANAMGAPGSLDLRWPSTVISLDAVRPFTLSETTVWDLASGRNLRARGGGRQQNSTIGGGAAISGSQKLGPHDFVVVPSEDYDEALIVKRSLRRAGPNKFRAKKYYAVFLRNNMKKTAVYADWDSVEVLKIKHTGYFKFKREKSFTAAYNRIVAFITHYNDKLCTDIDSDSDGDDE